MKFEYPKIEGFYQPIIPVTLRRHELMIGAQALVDSGAHRSIFDAQYAEHLGIDDVTSGIETQFSGITGDRLVGYQHDVTLEIGGNRFGPLSIAFSYDIPPGQWYDILGQEDFFTLFPIKFSRSKKQIHLMYGGPG